MRLGFCLLAILSACGAASKKAPAPETSGENAIARSNAAPMKPAGGDDEDLLAQAVEARMNANAEAAFDCYRVELANDRNVGGAMTVNVTVMPDGKTGDITVTGSFPEPFANCLKQIWQSSKWPERLVKEQISVALPYQWVAPEVQPVIRSTWVRPKVDARGITRRELIGEKTGTPDYSLTLLQIPAHGATLDAEAGSLLFALSSSAKTLRTGDAMISRKDEVVRFDGAATLLLFTGKNLLKGKKTKVVSANQTKAYSGPDGNGSARLYFNAKDFPEVALQHLEMPAGNRIANHLHEGSVEILWIAQGAADMTVGDNSYNVEAGDAVVIPAGTMHSVSVSTPLVALQMYSPPGPEQRFTKSTP